MNATEAAGRRLLDEIEEMALDEVSLVCGLCFVFDGWW